MLPTRPIDIKKRIPWRLHLFAGSLTLVAMATVGYAPVGVLALCGEEPWGWPWGMITPFLCILGVCVGVGVGLLFGYGIAERLADNGEGASVPGKKAT